MKLSELLGSRDDIGSAENGDPVILGLALDSRAVAPGYLFAALPGSARDGRDFIPDAVSRGAAAILTGTGLLPDTDVGEAVWVQDDNPRCRFSELAAQFYQPHPKTVAAITGTNGKTSVASFTRQLWQAMTYKAASIGTLGVEGDGSGGNEQAGLTTPDPITLNTRLQTLAKNDVQHVAIEASSHGLSQYRLDGVRLSVAAFTNLTRDHLDYHQTVEGYLAAKTRLFSEVLPTDGAAVINTDGEFGGSIANVVRKRGVKIMTVGRAKSADIFLRDVDIEPSGQRLDISFEGASYDILLPLHGAFQADNALLAAAILLTSGKAPEDVFPLLEKLTGVAGRFEKAGQAPSGGQIFIDYAHTPDGLRNILTAARQVTRGALHVIFGCGGDRDAGKRPEMGAIADDLADRITVTDDNPRSENPAEIRRQILTAVPRASEADSRAVAIADGIAALKADDVLIITGKGHETGQEIEGEIFPFSDFEAVRDVLCQDNEEAQNAL